MARKPNPKRAEALKIWLKSGREKKLVEIAKELEVSDGLVRKWKSQDHWDDIPNEGPRRGAPYRNKNAVGNNGGAPLNNQNAVTHGYFRKWLPDDEELKEIYDAARDGMSMLDILYEDILVSFTNFIRAQKIMYVKDQDDMTKEVKKQKTYSDDDSTTEEIEYEIQFAWDKQAKALNAQAAASRALTNKIKQFESMLRSMPPEEVKKEHRLKLEQIRLTIDKSKAEVKQLTANDINTDESNKYAYMTPEQRREAIERLKGMTKQ